jgi:hypothetical protein
VSVLLTLAALCTTALAQTKDNKWIAEQLEKGGGNLMAVVAVFLAAVLIGLGLIRRSRQGGRE